ncbi:MAG: hypothetical protein OQK82_07475 [Candidatus Pacearchaeota archaeon]|nr:hypothetical protein [Candidatus Pacearchaeota archaeon]
MNNKGWIRIVEAFFSLLLITGVLLIVINKGYIGREDISQEVYDLQISVLREIELNDDLRHKILEINESSLPVEDNNSTFPQAVKDKIDERMPNYFICRSKICDINAICELSQYIEEDVYAQPVAITANLEIYSPRKLVLFCWVD